MHTAILLAGGLGTRLQSVVHGVPKPMALVGNKPFLQHIFTHIQTQGITHVVLAVGYKHEQIQEYFGNRHEGLEIKYSVEHAPLGTGGALRQAFELVEGPAFVLNGDTLFKIDLLQLKRTYENTKCDIVVALKKLSYTDRYGTVHLDTDNRITAFTEKQFQQEDGLINGGVYYFDKRVLQVANLERFSLEKDVLERNMHTLDIRGETFDSYFIDIGIPEDYKKAQDELAQPRNQP